MVGKGKVNANVPAVTQIVLFVRAADIVVAVLMTNWRAEGGNAAAAAVPARVVQELLGHSTISLTLGTYSHTTPALRQEAANQMDLLFRTA